MKKYTLLMPGLLALTLAACSDENGSGAAEEKGSLLTDDWNEVSEAAKGQEVNMYMWGGNDNINRYLDEWVAPRLKEELDVELTRVPVNDAQDIINQL
nr:ABC transporter substrate-binding protein [Planococcus sp. (in: firmicutes)]